MQDNEKATFKANGKLAVQVSYTIDTRRGGPSRKTEETTLDKLQRVLLRLAQRDAYSIQTRVERPTAA
jgi:hypothetical protein